MRRISIFAAASAVALLAAGAASAQTSNVTVQQINAQNQTALTNVAVAGAVRDLTVDGAAIGSNTQVENVNVNLSGPGWVSATTGIGGQNSSGYQTSVTNATLVGAGRDADIGSQAIGVNASAKGTRVNVDTTISQRANNSIQSATTNMLLTAAGRDLTGSAVSVGTSLSATGTVSASLGGTSTANTQLVHGSSQYATLNAAGFLAGRDLGLSSQAVGASASFEAPTVNATLSQVSNAGDPWPVSMPSTQVATTNAFGGIALRDASIGSTAIGLTASFTGVNVNANVAQSNYGGVQTAITNVGFVGAGRDASFGSTAVGANISVKGL